MQNHLRRFIVPLFILLSSTPSFAADRYWVHKPYYENFFSTAAELTDWQLVEDNGTGGWALTGNGTALLTMDNAAGSYANRLFNVNGGSPRLFPLDRLDGRVEIMVKAISGGNQRIFVQVQQFDASNNYLGEFSVLPAQSATGFFSINLSDFTWNAAADKVRFMIGGENYSGQQGTIEFDYFSYGNGNGNWNNSANWSAVSNGASGASVPDLFDMVFFDGAGGNNGSCLLTSAITVAGIQFSNVYSGNLDLNGYQLTIGSGGAIIAGGGVTGNGATIIVNGNIAISGGAYKNTAGHNYTSGNLSITGGVLDFSTGDVIFDSAGDQQFSSSQVNPIRKLVINKPTGTVYLNSDILISDTLVLTQGNIETNGNIVRLGLSATQIGKLVTGSSKINGSLKRWISNSTTGDIVYPMGNTIADAPVTLTVNSAATTGGSVTVTYTDAAPGYDAVFFTDGTDIITERSTANWTLQTAGISGGNYSLTMSNNHLGSVPNLNSLHLTLATSAAGTHQAATGTLSNPSLHRTLLAATDIANTWYASIATSVLAVKWLSFNAVKENNTYRWKWIMATQEDIDHYQAQYSTDGIQFITAGIVAPQPANLSYIFSSALPAAPVLYFRIKSIDKYGKINFSEVVKITENKTALFSCYPNPAVTKILIKWPYSNATVVTVFITDASGKLVLQKNITNTALITLAVNHLPAGNYFVNCIDDKKRIAKAYPIVKIDPQ